MTKFLKKFHTKHEGGKVMTQKELLYMEDAIGHETNLIEICNYTIDSLQDKALKTFMKGQLKKHNTMKEKLTKVLEDFINE